MKTGRAMEKTRFERLVFVTLEEGLLLKPTSNAGSVTSFKRPSPVSCKTRPNQKCKNAREKKANSQTS